MITQKLVVVGKLSRPGREEWNAAGKSVTNSNQTGFLIVCDFYSALEKEFKKYSCDKCLGCGRVLGGILPLGLCPPPQHACTRSRALPLVKLPEPGYIPYTSSNSSDMGSVPALEFLLKIPSRVSQRTWQRTCHRQELPRCLLRLHQFTCDEHPRAAWLLFVSPFSSYVVGWESATRQTLGSPCV